MRLVRAYWKVLNPFTRWLAGYVPWWVVLETTGRRSGKRRRIPFANGTYDGERIQLIAVHGVRSAFAHNIAADPRIVVIDVDTGDTSAARD